MQKGIPEEVPFGLAVSTLGGVWIKEDIPMLLHLFEHIVRGTLLNWWDEMLDRHAKSGEKSLPRWPKNTRK